MIDFNKKDLLKILALTDNQFDLMEEDTHPILWGELERV